MRLIVFITLCLFKWVGGNPYQVVAHGILDDLRTKSDGCSKQLATYVSALLAGETWALEMFDSTSKLQSGLIHGNMVDMGDFDLCISIKNDSSSGPIKGKYCMGLMNVTFSTEAQKNFRKEIDLWNLKGYADRAQEGLKLSWMWSFCIPDTCSGTEVAAVINQLFGSVGIPAYLTNIIPDQEIGCQTEDTINKPLDGGAIAAISIFAIIFAVILLETAYDVYLHYIQSNPSHELLIAFSVLTNGRKLIKVVKREDQLPCLDGIRFISIMWVVVGHRYSATMSVFGMVNTQDIILWADQMYSMYIGAGTLSVDTFFLVGGLLVTYIYMKAMSKGVKFNIPIYYLHRYIRLTPALAALTLVMATLSPYLTSGPNYPTFLQYNSDVCKEYWWSTLLYVENYVNVNSMCMGHSWYLDVDMQLFILSPILLIPLRKWPKWTLAATCLLILACMGGTAYIASHYELSSMLTILTGNTSDYQEKYYLPTHTRATPWLIGLILGYYVYQIKSQAIRFKLNKLLVVTLWIASLSVLLTCVFGGHSTLRGPEYDPLGNVLHIAFNRPAWAVGLCWVILACLFGYGGPVNYFLSLPLFQVLNRLTYSIYIIHVMFLYGMCYARRTNIYFSDFTMLYLFWGDFTISIALAVVWTLAFESPMITVERVLFGNIGMKKPPEKKIEDQA